MTTMPPFPVIDGVRFAHIPDWPGYAASDDGRIWTCKVRYQSMVFGPWKERKPHRKDASHEHLSLCFRQNGMNATVSVHAMVLTAFVGPRPRGMVCRHFPDRDPSNNRLSNLQWGTIAENVWDSQYHGTYRAPPAQLGETNPMAKLTEQQVVSIYDETENESLSSVAARHGLSVATVSNIANGKVWTHLGLPPRGPFTENRIHRGESNGSAKLTQSQVDDIRRRYAAGGVFQRQLAKEYGITQAMVSQITRRTAWRTESAA